MEKDCVFCKIIKGEIPADKVTETENFIVMNDIHPVSEGHCLVIAKKHFENIFDIPSCLGDELVSLVKEQGLRLIKKGKADGIKVVQNNGEASGQTVFHFHVHLIPEKSGVTRKKHI